MQYASILLAIYWIGYLTAAAIFLLHVYVERRVFGTPWTWLSAGTRLVMLIAFWPIALPVMCWLFVPPAVRYLSSRGR